MSQENVEIVRRAIEAFNREDFDAALQDAAPDMTLDWSHSRGLNAGIYVGQDAIRRFWTDMVEPFEQHDGSSRRSSSPMASMWSCRSQRA